MQVYITRILCLPYKREKYTNVLNLVSTYYQAV